MLSDKLFVDSPNNNEPGMGSLSRLNILIVDDSAHIRRLLLSMLTPMGAQNIFEARTLAQARTVLNTKTLDLAIIDWMLDDPAGDGMALVTEIRQSPLETVTYLPIIMMTGHTERENIELARDMGVTEFLAKPFTAKNLHARLNMLIESPRPFVKSRSYFGPDRRRREHSPIEGLERRNTSPRRIRST